MLIQVKMCSASSGSNDDESRGIITINKTSTTSTSSTGEASSKRQMGFGANEEEEEEEEEDRPLMGESARGSGGGEARLLHGFFRRYLPLHAHQGRLPLAEAGEEVAALLKLACPILMTTLLIYSRSFISMVFLGRLGKTELAGGSLALGFVNITGLSLIKGLAMGMDPICGQAYGAKRWSVLSQTYLKTLLLLLLVSAPICVLWLNVEPIFLLLGQDPDTSAVASVYLAYCVPELIAQAILHPIRSFLRTQGLTAPLTMSALAALILHTPINYLLVVHFGLGVKGVALAVGFNTINLNIGLLVYVMVSKAPLKPWRGITGPSVLQGWKPLLSLAFLSAISVCLEWWWYEIMLFLCGLLANPQASVAATGILIQTAGILYSFPYSLSASLTTRVGHSLGAGQPSRAQWTAIVGIATAFAIGLTALVVTIVLRSLWGRLYTDEAQILDLIAIGLPLLGLSEVANSPQTAACGVLTGTARPKDGARINLCAFYIVGLPVAVVLTFQMKMGFRGLWIGLVSAQVTCLALMVYTLVRTDWKHQAKRADELTSAVGQRDDLEQALLAAADQ